MIETKSALRHVESFRFANLDFAPDAEGTKALAKMLGEHASSNEHAGAVVASWIAHWPKWPRPSDIKQFCEQTPDPHMTEVAQTRKECQRCGGSGWISVQGPHGTSAAYPCTHQPGTDADRRMGVQIHPSVVAHYRQLDIEADGRRRRWIGSGGRPNSEVVADIVGGL